MLVEVLTPSESVCTLGVARMRTLRHASDLLDTTPPEKAAPMSENQNARLAGKRVLITGTAGGQGEAAQRLFLQQGASVVGCDLRPGAAEASAKALREEGYDARGYDLDLSDPDATAAWVESAATSLGGIDVLYNNAAGFGFSPFANMTLAL